MQIIFEWLLGGVYLLAVFFFSLCAILAGSVISPRWRGKCASSFLLNLARRFVIGLGLFSGTVVCLGSIGQISALPVLAAWTALLIPGAARLALEHQYATIAVHARNSWHTSLLRYKNLERADRPLSLLSETACYLG